MPNSGEKQTIQIREWVKRGTMLYKTSGLGPDDPDHPWNQALDQGVNPEDFGIEDPLEEMFKDWSIGRLRREVLDLRKELESVLQHL